MTPGAWRATAIRRLRGGVYSAVMNVGIMLPNWIGDTVMATPTLRALRRHFGAGARLTGVLRPYLADVLAGTSWLDELILFNPRSKAAAQRGWSVAGQLRARRLDVLVLLTNSFRTGLIGLASGARRRIGYARYGRGLMLTRRLYPPRNGWRLTPTPAIDAYLQLAYAAGCGPELPNLELATLPADEAAADALSAQVAIAARRSGGGLQFGRGIRGRQALAGRTFRRPGQADRPRGGIGRAR